jgi:predicted nucleic acid-binding protein
MAEKPTIYVESCCVIDAAKYQDPSKAPPEKRDDVQHIQWILKAAEQGEIVVYTSSLTIAECQHVGEHPPSEELKRLFKSILTSGKVIQLISDSIFIGERARDLRWDHDITLRGADAVHVASAIEQGCEEFITTDARGPIKNAAKIAKLGLRVIRASETKLLPASYKPPPLFDLATQQASAEILTQVNAHPEEKGSEAKNVEPEPKQDMLNPPGIRAIFLKPKEPDKPTEQGK